MNELISGCAGSALLHKLCSSCGEQGRLPSPWDVDFSLGWLLLLWSTGSGTRGLQQLRHVAQKLRALEHGLDSCGAQAELL